MFQHELTSYLKVHPGVLEGGEVQQRQQAGAPVIINCTLDGVQIARTHALINGGKDNRIDGGQKAERNQTKKIFEQ